MALTFWYAWAQHKVESKAGPCLVDFTAHCHGVWLYVHVTLIWQFGNFFLSEFGQIWAIFLMENPLYSLKLLFLRSKFGKISPKQKRSFGEDSFHHFLFWRIFFNFAKCF